MNATEWGKKCHNEIERLEQFFGKLPEVHSLRKVGNYTYLGDQEDGTSWYLRDTEEEKKPERFDQWLDDI